MNDILDSSFMYILCGAVVITVAVICVVFLVRAYRMGLSIGMKKHILNRTIFSSAVFSVVPSVGILIGVIALSGSLGIPFSWMRLSVIGALHYETSVAQAAAEQAGLPGLSMNNMTAQAFSTIALLMGVCIMWEIVFSVIFTKRYSARISSGTAMSRKSSFVDTAVNALFVGFISAYIASYIGIFVTGGGFYAPVSCWLPIAVAGVSAASMAVFTWLAGKTGRNWIDNLSVTLSMVIAMFFAVII